MPSRLHLRNGRLKSLERLKMPKKKPKTFPLLMAMNQLGEMEVSRKVNSLMGSTKK
jgi:hypothetical protein